MNKSGENCAGLRAVFTSPILRNSIIWGNEVSNGPAAAAQIDCKSYDARYCCIQDLQPHLRVGGNIAADPLFADSAAGDYHLKSQGGRYDPAAQVWVTDEVTSPAIDAGDPLAPIGTEPFANGGIINIGAYGQTAQASKAWFGTAPCQTIVAGDINGDCTVNLADMAILSRHWLTDFGQ
ncbi:MAG: hypothetical protein IH624_11305 [Phycisphaerae bacterium]|nr:hypothetical protein [Phycisphaerae bacterium]